MNWALDVTHHIDGVAQYAFCPIADDGRVLPAAYVDWRPPGPLAKAIHADGQEAVDAWVAAHRDELEALVAPRQLIWEAT